MEKTGSIPITPLRGVEWITGFTDKTPLVLIESLARKGYDTNGNPTGGFDCVRMVARSRNGAEIYFDLRPFAPEKLDRCKQSFGIPFTMSDVLGISDCRIYAYQGKLRVAVSAVDFQPKIEL